MSASPESQAHKDYVSALEVIYEATTAELENASTAPNSISAQATRFLGTKAAHDGLLKQMSEPKIFNSFEDLNKGANKFDLM